MLHFSIYVCLELPSINYVSLATFQKCYPLAILSLCLSLPLSVFSCVFNGHTCQEVQCVSLKSGKVSAVTHTHTHTHTHRWLPLMVYVSRGPHPAPYVPSDGVRLVQTCVCVWCVCVCVSVS